MLPGPVFNIELITTARRARYFVVRAVYAAILLFVIWQNYQARAGWWGTAGREISIREMASFASGLFYTFAITQAVAVLLLTPVLMAGAIADERQRRTLHYLMASHLSSAEIVLGKLMARMLHLGVYLGVGLPILSMLTLFGGIAPDLIGTSYLLTLSAVVFLSGLSILVSTYARTVREAIVVVFLLTAAWLVFPLLLTDPLEDTWPAIHALIDPINDWVLATSPLSLIPGLGVYAPGTPPGRVVAWLAGLQVLCGTLFVSASIWRLRPAFRAQPGETRGGVSWVARISRPWRILPRPAISERPMLWKELHIVRPGGIVRWVVRACAVVGFLLLAYWTLVLGLEAAEQRWFRVAKDFGAVERFNLYLRSMTGLLYVLWILGIAVNASATVTAEKEGDTWLSLIGTPLSGHEILVAKMLGAVWSMRALGITMAVLWLFGIATTAVHPIGVMAVVIEWSVFTWFAAALGVCLSLRSRNTTRATVATVAILIFVNGGYLLCCIPLSPDTIVVALGSTPFLLAASLISGEELLRLLGSEDASYFNSKEMFEMLATCVLGSLAYLTAAVLLTSSSLRGFDEAVERPSRRQQDEIAPHIPTVTPSTPADGRTIGH